MSTATIVYIGFSLTDSYLNELRSGVLSMLDWAGSGHAPESGAASPSHVATPTVPPLRACPSAQPGLVSHMQFVLPERVKLFREKSSMYPALTPRPEGHRPPIAYAILNDSPEVEQEFLRKHEGVHVLSWTTGKYLTPPLPKPQQDWFGMDRYLTNLYEGTNIHHRVGNILHGKRILMVDPYIGVDQLALYLLEVTARYTRGLARKEAAADALAAKRGQAPTSRGSEGGGAASSALKRHPDACTIASVASKLHGMVSSSSGGDSHRHIMTLTDPHTLPSPTAMAATPTTPSSGGAGTAHTSTSTLLFAEVIHTPVLRQVSASAVGGAGAVVEGEDGSRAAEPTAVTSGAPAFEDPTVIDACDAEDITCEIVIKRSVEDALKVLEEDPVGRPWDVIVCNYGWKSADEETTSGQLVREVRTRLPRSKWAPVIAYGSGIHVEANRRRAVADGCFDFCYTAYGLVARLERLFHYAVDVDGFSF